MLQGHSFNCALHALWICHPSGALLRGGPAFSTFPAALSSRLLAACLAACLPPEERCYPASAAAGLPLAECCYRASAVVSRLMRAACFRPEECCYLAAAVAEVEALTPVAARAAVTADAAAAVPNSTTAIAANTTAVRDSGRSSRGQC